MSPAFALALLLAAQGATSTTAPPAEVVVRHRDEAAWATVTVAVERGPVAASHLPLLAALLSVAETWESGPVRRLRDRGGTFEARATPDGLVLLAGGPAGEDALVLEAAGAALDLEDIAPLALSRAQGLFMRHAALDDERGGAVERQMLWSSWYGDDAPPRTARLDALRAHRLEASALVDDLRALRAHGRLHRFGDGRLSPTTVEALGALPPQPSTAVAPRPRTEDSLASARGPRTRLTLAQPLPLERAHDPALMGDLESWLEQALAAALAPESRRPRGAVVDPLAAAWASVEVEVDTEVYRDAALLFVTITHSQELGAADVDHRVREALAGLRDAPISPLALKAASARTRSRDARSLAAVGSFAERKARHRLAGGEPAPVDDRGLALRGLLFPEILRGVVTGPAPAAR